MIRSVVQNKIHDVHSLLSYFHRVKLRLIFDDHKMGTAL